jgi:hypothetical protein
MFDIDNQDGIVLEFCGGLGNRIWQLTAAIITALKYNKSIYLDKSTCVNHGGTSVDYFSNIFKDIGIDKMTISSPFPQHNTYYIQFMISTEAYTIENLNFPILFNQYFQYYPPMKAYETQVRDIFVNNISEYRDKIITKYPDVTNSMFIHIRRGDYLKFPRHPIPPIEYYQTCLNKYCELCQQSIDDLSIYVFSDDFDWVKSEPFFMRGKIKPIDLKDEVETLAFMSLCKKGAICANSSFSWWGAFLGAHSARSPVFVPQNWILEARIDSLFPDEWHVISGDDFKS